MHFTKLEYYVLCIIIKHEFKKCVEILYISKTVFSLFKRNYEITISHVFVKQVLKTKGTEKARK